MGKMIDEMKVYCMDMYNIPDGNRQDALNGWNEYCEHNSFKDIWHLSNGMRMYFMGYARGLNSRQFSDYISHP